MKVLSRVLKGPTQIILSPYHDENALGGVKGPTQILPSLYYQRNALGLVKGPASARQACERGRTLLEHERYYDLGMDALIIECTRIGRLLWFGHGCSSDRMLLEHKRYYGLGMDAPVTVCSWNTNVIMVWAWMLQ